MQTLHPTILSVQASSYSDFVATRKICGAKLCSTMSLAQSKLPINHEHLILNCKLYMVLCAPVDSQQSWIKQPSLL